MRPYVAFALALSLVPLASAQAPDCTTLLTAQEIQSTCGVPDAEVGFNSSRTSCMVSAQRPGAVSALNVVVSQQETVQGARMTVEMASAMGAASEGQTTDGIGDEAIGQLAQVLGMQDANAPAAAPVSQAEAASRQLPDLGDGGVRYVMDLGGAMGIKTHTVTFSIGATLVKLESGIVANRAGVCTADGLETLARIVASRL